MLINPASKFQVSIVEIDLHGRYLITKLQVEHTITGNPNAVLANRKIRCIYAVLANKIIICVYLCSCVFMSRFGHPVLKKVPLKLIPRSRNGPIFKIPRSRIRPKTNFLYSVLESL